MPLETFEVQCPYCGETVEVDIEPLEEAQSMIEDCTVCCHPMQISVTSGENGVEVNASRSD